jgi:PAP2 superfamily
MARLLRQPRTIAVAAWLVAFAVAVGTLGYPTRRTTVLLWVAMAIVALGIERPRATARSFATLWLPLFVALAAYDRLRGASDPSQQASAHTWPHVDLDVWLGAGTTPTEQLQGWLWTTGSPRWWDFGAWVVYQSHFVVPLLVAAVLWGVRHHLARRYVLGLAALSWMALLTYWLYPAQPPWMVARDGLIGDLDRIVPQVWREVGIERAERVFETSRNANANRFANPVAALPSLHAAFPMLIAAFLWGTRRWLDVLLATYALAMATTLVYTGEHFTFDILLGWAFALLVALPLRRYQRRPSTTRSNMPGSQASAVGTGGSEPVVEEPTLSRR